MQGTLPFESNESLRGEPVEYYHDLQSYFWLAYLITCNCTGPFNMRRDWNWEIQRSQSGQPVTPAFINTCAEIKTKGHDWKNVLEERILSATSSTTSVTSSATSVPPPAAPSAAVDINYLTWVRPGAYGLTPIDIVKQRQSMKKKDFVNLMTPYFARHQAVREGMLELRKLFLGRKTLHPDGYYRQEPSQRISYDQVLSILRRIRDGIDFKDDAYPSEEYLRDARTRYRRYLQTGIRMPLMAEEEEVLTGLGSSSKRAAMSHPDGSMPRDSKRRRGRGAASLGDSTLSRRSSRRRK